MLMQLHQCVLWSEGGTRNRLVSRTDWKGKSSNEAVPARRGAGRDVAVELNSQHTLHIAADSRGEPVAVVETLLHHI